MSDMLCKHYESGRLFVEKESDIPKMLDIIREIDPEAFEKFPNSLVCVFSEEDFADMPFEELSETNLDMARVLHKAWENGIKCFVVFGNAGDLNNYHMKFGYKQYGRIFVEKESDILCLKCLIMGMDSFEYDYLPKNLIAVFNTDKSYMNGNEYTGKFDDLNMATVLYRAWLLGIKCFVAFADDEY